MMSALLKVRNGKSGVRGQGSGVRGQGSGVRGQGPRVRKGDWHYSNVRIVLIRHYFPDGVVGNS